MKDILKEILSAQQLREGAAWKRLNFAADAVIIRKGDVGTTLFFVEHGTLRVTGEVALDGRKQIYPGVCDLENGSIFGEICLHYSQIRMANVSAVTDVQLLEIDGEMLSVYLDDNPILGYLFYKRLFEIMINRLGTANQRIENLMVWGLKAGENEKYS